LAYGLVIVAAFVHTALQAGECKKPKVFFINGVFNEKWEAKSASLALQKAIRPLSGLEGLQITTIYNPTDGNLGDVAEIAQDAVLARNYLVLAYFTALGTDWATFVGPPLMRDFISWITKVNTNGKTYTQWLNEQINDTAPSTRNKQVVEKIKSKLLTEVRDNKTPVVVIAHSQGNFYLNQAILELKTDDRTRDIPGVQAIGVLGIGVASRINLAASPVPSGPRLYKYVTKEDDVVIGILDQKLPPNFTNVEDFRVVTSTATHHEVVDDYLHPIVRGTFNGVERVRIRDVVVGEFKKVYDATVESFPCVDTLTATPNPIVADRPVTFAAKALSSNGVPITNGSIAFGDGVSVEYCASVLAADGTASCSITFGSTPVPTKLYAQWTSGVFKSSPESIDVSAATCPRENNKFLRQQVSTSIPVSYGEAGFAVDGAFDRTVNIPSFSGSLVIPPIDQRPQK
jgi:hypothetical protein